MGANVRRTQTTSRNSIEREVVVQFNNLLQALRTVLMPQFAEDSTDSDLDYSGFTFLDENSVVRNVAAGTITTIATTTVTASSGGFGTFTIVVDSGTGVVSTVVPGASQVYATAALALAAAEPPAAGTQAVAVILIEGDGTDWVANTDSFSDDLTSYQVIDPNDTRLPSTFEGTDALLNLASLIENQQASVVS